MLYLLLHGIICYQEFKISTFGKISNVASFGFQKGAVFSFEFETSDPYDFEAFLLTKRQLDTAVQKSTQLCQSDGFNTKYYLTLKESTQKNYWMGTIQERGIYFLVLRNCHPNNSEVIIRANFSNGNSYLDTRDQILPLTYQVFCAIYYAIAIIWAINGYVNSNFRIPLHTVFTALPIVRAISLSISGSIWIQKKNFDYVSPWKNYATLLLEVTYYCLLFTGNALACTGFCTFKERLKRDDPIQIIISSLLLSMSLTLINRGSSFKGIISLMVLLILSLIWYLKYSLINVIIAIKVLKKMKNELVRAKLKLSIDFVLSFQLTLFVTILVSFFIAGIELRQCICAITLEIGLVICSFIQMKFFLFRKRYSGNIVTVQKQKTEHRFSWLVEPRSRSLVCLERNYQ